MNAGRLCGEFWGSWAHMVAVKRAGRRAAAKAVRLRCGGMLHAASSARIFELLLLMLRAGRSADVVTEHAPLESGVCTVAGGGCNTSLVG